MPFIIETFDKPGHQAVRQAHRPAHLDFLDTHKHLLLACLLLLVVALPFVNYAPNRLLSGEGRWLWQLAPWLTAVQVCGALLLILLCWLPGRRPLLLSLLMLDALLALLFWGAGQTAVQLAHSGSSLARTSPGSGLWLALALCLLLASETIRRLTTRAHR